MHNLLGDPQDALLLSSDHGGKENFHPRKSIIEVGKHNSWRLVMDLDTDVEEEH